MNNSLSSSALVRDKLRSKAKVVAKFPKLHSKGKAPTLAIKLAYQSFFGDTVVVQCTPGGGKSLPVLLTAELNLLK